MKSPEKSQGGMSLALIAELRTAEAEVFRPRPAEIPGCVRQRHFRFPWRRADALDERLADAVPDRRRAGARGATLIDIDGNRLDDFCLGDTGSMFGHSPAPGRPRHPAAGVARPHLHAARARTRWPSESSWSERFGLPQWQVATTASDANRFALRVARAVTGRAKILVFNGCYHGAVDETFVKLTDGKPGKRAGAGGRIRDLTGGTQNRRIQRSCSA